MPSGSGFFLRLLVREFRLWLVQFIESKPTVQKNGMYMYIRSKISNLLYRFTAVSGKRRRLDSQKLLALKIYAITVPSSLQA